MKALKFFIIGVVLLISKNFYAQEIGEYSIGLLRQNDNISIFKRQEEKTFYSSLKYLPLNESTYVSFGGSWRFQAESFINEQFQKEGSQDNIWYLNRFLLHSHLNVNNKFELFAELGSSLAIGKNDKSPVDKDVLYVNQLFAKYKITQNWDIALGRHNIRLGFGRLVDIREGPNIRRLFDFAELNYQTKDFKAKTFFSIPVKPIPEVFDNDYLNFSETFSGIYTTSTFSKATNFDAYVFYQKDDRATYNNGVENERRVSIGIRNFGTYKKLTYNNEAVYQIGKFGNQDISAWTLSLNIERETIIFGKEFGLGIKTEAISGDRNATDNKMNTFDGLYSRGAYFGRAAKFGPSNLLDVHPYIKLEFNKLEIEVDYVAFWRYSVDDGVYGAALTLDYPDTNNKTFIAQQIGTDFGYQLNKFVFIELESNIIFPGGFLKTSNQGNSLYHFVLTTEIKF